MQKQRLFLILFLLLSFSVAYSQQFMNKTKKEVLKTLNSYEKKQNIKSIIHDKGDSITFLLRDSNWQHLDQHYYFNAKGKCFKEVVTANCDSCFQQYVNKLKRLKVFRWKPLSPSKYLSNYTYRLLLFLDPQRPFTYSLEKISLKRRAFNQLRNSQKV